MSLLSPFMHGDKQSECRDKTIGEKIGTLSRKIAVKYELKQCPEKRECSYRSFSPIQYNIKRIHECKQSSLVQRKRNGKSQLNEEQWNTVAYKDRNTRPRIMTNHKSWCIINKYYLRKRNNTHY